MNKNNCYAPVGNNPFMNNMYGLDKSMTRESACIVERSDIENQFYENSSFKPVEKKLEDNFMRPFYTQPVTDSIAGSSFAKFLYPNTSKCRDTGYICKTNCEQLKQNDRLVTETLNYKDSKSSIKYFDISNIYKNN